MSEVIEEYFPNIPEACLTCPVLKNIVELVDVAKVIIDKNEPESESGARPHPDFETILSDVQYVAWLQYSNCPGTTYQPQDDGRPDSDRSAPTIVTPHCPKAVS